MRNIGLIFILITLAFNVHAKERVEWKQGEEIILQLVVEKERRVVFPEPVNFYEEKGHTSLFSKSFIDTSFYITASTSFSTRLVFQSSNSQRIYIIRAVASAEEQSHAVTNVLTIQLPSENNEGDESTEQNNVPWATESKVTAVDLVQLAAQSLYSEIIEPVDGVQRVAVERSRINGFYRMGGLDAEPIAAWFGGGLYVTAVGLTNTTSEVISFDPCRIRGDFLYASAQFPDLKAKGTNQNENVAYLVSDVPFSKAISSRVIKCLQK
ncbi:DUF3438 family protein [Vibrio ostreicida]|uniref:DUF3438 family protein n=1 Tax=Vibrio ostreicida TaxID=526588 RepID=UPI003B5C827E